MVSEEPAGLQALRPAVYSCSSVWGCMAWGTYIHNLYIYTYTCLRIDMGPHLGSLVSTPYNSVSIPSIYWLHYTYTLQLTKSLGLTGHSRYSPLRAHAEPGSWTTSGRARCGSRFRSESFSRRNVCTYTSSSMQQLQRTHYLTGPT